MDSSDKPKARYVINFQSIFDRFSEYEDTANTHQVKNCHSDLKDQTKKIPNMTTLSTVDLKGFELDESGKLSKTEYSVKS